MSVNIQDRHLIDRYLQGEVSGIELEQFNQRLKAENHFLQEVELQKIIYAGIQVAYHNRLKNVVLSSLEYRKPLVPFALKMIVTFLFVTALGITLWFYVGTESAKKEQANSWFAFLRSKNSVQETKVESTKQKPDIQKTFVAQDSSQGNAENGSSHDDSLPEVQAALPVNGDSAVSAAHEEDIIVKQDQLLISTTLAVEEKDAGKEDGKASTLSNEAVQILNPAADLPVEEKPASDYLVEFWVSPINYRGYKMSKNKLILFGIEEPDAVKLYRVKNALYMSYLREFYRLNDSFDFVSYQKLKDSEIPLAIR